MVEILNLLAFLFGSFCFVFTLLRMFTKSTRISFYVYIIFYILFALPLGLDLFSGYTATYGMFDAITKAASNNLVNIIYAIFIIYFSLVFCAYSFSPRKNISSEKIKLSMEIMGMLYKKSKVILHIIIFLPIVLVFFAPENHKYLIYGYTSMRDFSEVSFGYVSLINMCVNLSILSVFVSIILKRKGFTSILRYFPILFVDIWLNGKRNAVALVLVFTIYLLITDKSLKIEIKGFIAIFIIVVMSYYLSFYSEIKPNIQNKESVRIEYFRDHTVKLAIYAELHPEIVQILEYRGQSFLFYLLIFVPREVWTEKPLPYAQYLTSAALESPPKLWGWGLTTSIFDELICNLGLWAILIIPFIIIRIIRFGESAQDSFSSIFTVLIIALLFSVQIVASLPMFILYFIYVKYMKRKIRKLER